jgi:diaminohydroxyphosphoribosylaminopyrimidine deaminase/5-amino-6-(5-phosphoribosylamino)uracil reductase
MKIAASLDGRTALPDGTSQWITGEAARTDGHVWRRRAGALLTGVGTVREDNPRLDVRHVETVLQPQRVIVDSRLETPPASRILDAPGSALIYAAIDDAAQRAALEARGARIAFKPGSGGKVDLAAMLDDLAAREINELHVEAGHKLNGSLVRENLVDEFLVYLAPRLIGAGREMAAFGPLASLADALPLRFVDITRIGDDLGTGFVLTRQSRPPCSPASSAASAASQGPNRSAPAQRMAADCASRHHPATSTMSSSATASRSTEPA